MQNTSAIAWTIKQIKFIEVKANPLDERQNEELESEIGVCARTLYNWQKLPGFWDAVYDRARTCLKSELPKILKAMADKATGPKKDVNAAKLCLEACGVINSKVVVEHSGRVDHDHNHYDFSGHTAEELKLEAGKLALELEAIANVSQNGNGNGHNGNGNNGAGDGDQGGAGPALPT